VVGGFSSREAGIAIMNPTMTENLAQPMPEISKPLERILINIIGAQERASYILRSDLEL
jgi:hypothetical protein